MELSEPTTPFQVRQDRRRTIPEPPPVRLVAVEDLHLPAAAGAEIFLDRFYAALLRFERDATEPEFPVYRAENARLRFDILEPPVMRETMRATGIEVPSLAQLEAALVDREIEFQIDRGLTPGRRALVLQDPAGNWVEITERRLVG